MEITPLLIDGKDFNEAIDDYLDTLPDAGGEGGEGEGGEGDADQVEDDVNLRNFLGRKMTVRFHLRSANSIPKASCCNAYASFTFPPRKNGGEVKESNQCFEKTQNPQWDQVRDGRGRVCVVGGYALVWLQVCVCVYARCGHG